MPSMESFLSSAIIAVANDYNLLRQNEPRKQRLLQELCKASTEEGVHRSKKLLMLSIQKFKEALCTSDPSLQMAKLEDLEKLLQSHTITATRGMLIRAFTHFILAIVCNLRQDNEAAVHHALDMFLAAPRWSRTELAPAFWECLLLPQFMSVVAWYNEQRRFFMMADTLNVEESKDSSTQRMNGEFRTEITSMLQELEQLYEDLLDENTRIFAEKYKEDLKERTISLSSVTTTDSNQDSSSNGIAQVNQMTGSRSAEGQTQNDDTLPVEKINLMHDVSITGDQLCPTEESQILAMKSFLEGYAVKLPDLIGSNRECLLLGPTSSLVLLSTPSPDGPLSLYSDRGQPFVSKEKDKEEAEAEKEREGRGKEEEEKADNEDCIQKEDEKVTEKEEETEDELVEAEDEEDYGEEEVLLVEEDDEGKEEDQQGEKNHADEEQEEQDDEGLDESNEEDEPAINSIEGGCYENGGNYFEGHRKLEYEDEDTLSLSVGICSDGPRMHSPLRTKPPKELVCPITGHIFNDPVTLETGQTYELEAIRKWLQRGNNTCPVTHQKLQSALLPKTNYVLKRVISKWKEKRNQSILEANLQDRRSPQHSSIATGSFPVDFSECLRIHSPDSTTVQSATKSEVVRATTDVSNEDAIQALLGEVEPAILCLRLSNDLQECESVVPTILHVWQESNRGPSITARLTEDGVIKGLVKVLKASNIDYILETTLYILSELASMDESVKKVIEQEDADYFHIIELVKGGFYLAVVLLFHLMPSPFQLGFFDLLPLLLHVLKQCEHDDWSRERSFNIYIGPKEAACMLIDQMLTSGDKNAKSIHVHCILSKDALSPLVDCLEADLLEERISAVSVLLCCMQADGRCRSYIAQRAQLIPVLDLIHSVGERARVVAVSFLSELVRHNRMSINKQILQVIKEEGSLSTMHILLAQLQVVPMEERPTIASLLLQLDLLSFGRKRSIYREESIDVLIKSLTNEDSIEVQVLAAEALVALGGRFSSIGKPLMKHWLLKCAGINRSYTSDIGPEQEPESPLLATDVEDEDEVSKEWEEIAAQALAKFEYGMIFDALIRGMRSLSMDLARPCMLVATWLVHVLPSLAYVGVEMRLRKDMVSVFVLNLQLSINIEEKALAVLGLYSFLDESEGVQELLHWAKDLYKPLRKLKHLIWMANDILEKFLNSPIVYDHQLWCHAILNPPTNASESGEIRSLAFSKGRLFSGHSDGSLKVWDCKHGLSQIQNIKSHFKAVTCMCVSLSGNKLYSGSADKTIRAWTIKPEEIMRCVDHYEVKEAVQCITADAMMLCFALQGSGVRVVQAEKTLKSLPGIKHVQCLALVNGKLYCGCNDYNIQELDPTVEVPPVVIQQGVKNRFGKKALHCLQVFKDKLYSAGSVVNGCAAQVWSLSERQCVGHLAATSDTRALAVSDDFIYLGTSSGYIEVWLREKLIKVSELSVNSKINCLLTVGDMLFCGSEDGKLRSWTVG